MNLCLYFFYLAKNYQKSKERYIDFIENISLAKHFLPPVETCCKTRYCFGGDNELDLCHDYDDGCLTVPLLPGNAKSYAKYVHTGYATRARRPVRAIILEVD